MATQKSLILANVKTVLETITVANGYRTNVELVEKVIRDWQDTGSGSRPWIGFMPQVQLFEAHSFGNLRVTLPILIAAHIVAATEDLADDALTDLEDDIVDALSLDTTRGGNATFTRLISQQDDIGDPDSTDHNGAGGTLVIKINVVYHRSPGSS